MSSIAQLYKYYGLKGLAQKVHHKLCCSYEKYLRHEVIPSQAEMKQALESFTYQPLISIITPVYQPNLIEFDAYFDSILVQNPYLNIEICLVNDGTNDKATDYLITTYQKRYPHKIKYQKNAVNKGIASASNDAIKLATGEYIALIDQDDLIAPHAFYEYLYALQATKYDFLYSDEDMISQSDIRFNPAFKPDWSPHTLLSRMYVNHLSMYKKSIVDNVGGFRSTYDGCQDYDLLLRTSIYFEQVYHCPKILYHWRTSDNSIATSIENKDYIVRRAEQALTEHLESQGMSATVTQIPTQLIYNLNIRQTKKQALTIIFFPQADLMASIASLQLLLARVKQEKIMTNFLVFDAFHSKQRSTQFEQLDEHIECVSSLKDQLIQPYILFHYGNTTLINEDALTQLIGFSQLKKVGVVAPTVVNEADVIIENGGIIGIDNSYAYSGYGFTLGTSDYYGANYSTVNYTLTTSNLFIVTKKVLDGFLAEQPFSVETFCYDLCLYCSENGYYNCVVGNVIARLSAPTRQIDWTTIEKKIGANLSKDAFYNINFAKTKALLYKTK